MRRLITVFLLSLLAVNLSGCAVVAVADAAVSVASTAVSIGAKTVGLAADATIGTVRLVGNAVSGPSEPAAVAPAAKAAPLSSTASDPVRAAEPAAAEARPVGGSAPATPTPLPALR